MLNIILKCLGFLAGMIVVLVVVLFVSMSAVNSPVYAWRVLTMLQSDTKDINRFPLRPIANGSEISPLLVEYADIPATVTYSYKGARRTENLQELIERTDTAAFIVVRDDKIILQAYHDSEHNRPNTSFSVAKSFDSAMIGAAIQDGFIGSVDDPVVQYIPELAGRGLDTLTIRNLLRMDTGIRYISADDRPFFFEPFSDDALTYYPPDLRQIALSVKPSGTPIGRSFHYNNFHPLLEGMIIERATGMHVAEYLQERIWKPMGAEYPASWSLDSENSGFEKMESGINAAAVDFARFGLLYLHKGNWNGVQILPEAWVTQSTAPDPNDTRPFEVYPLWKELGGYYGYHWWGMKNVDGSYDFMARGNLGQVIYVAPEKNMVVVRFGPEPDSGVIWSFVIQSLVDQMP
jgi:CubicO group peptidase (beta-lactamase class C family)